MMKRLERVKRVAITAMAAAVITGGAAGALQAPLTVHASSIVEPNTTTLGSVTIKKTDGTDPLLGAQFSFYKIMSLTPGTQVGEFADFDIVAAYENILGGLSPDALGSYSTTQIEALSDQLLALSKTQTADKVTNVTAEDGIALVEELELGYYLVVETTVPDGAVAGKPFFVAIPSTNNYATPADPGAEWVYNIEISPKNHMVNVDKEIVNANGAHENGQAEGNSNDKDTVAIGDYVKFEINATAPNYSEEYFLNGKTPKFILKDTMTDGLALVTGDTAYPITVKMGTTALVEGKDYTLTAANNTGDIADLVITFTNEFLMNDANKSQVVTVSYYAEVTDDVVIGNPATGEDGNSNKVEMEYNNDPTLDFDDPNSTVTTPEEKITLYTFEIQVEKFGGEGSNREALTGAEFELYKDVALTEQVGGTLITGAEGKLSVTGVDAGTYYLKETKAPAGYTLLTNPIKIEIIPNVDVDGKVIDGSFTLKVNDAEITATEAEFVTYKENGLASIAVENKKGFTLPSTGGMGITIFVAVGLVGIMGVSAVILKKKKA